MKCFAVNTHCFQLRLKTGTIKAYAMKRQMDLCMREVIALICKENKKDEKIHETIIDE